VLELELVEELVNVAVVVVVALQVHTSTKSSFSSDETDEAVVAAIVWITTGTAFTVLTVKLVGLGATDGVSVGSPTLAVGIDVGLIEVGCSVGCSVITTFREPLADSEP